MSPGAEHLDALAEIVNIGVGRAAGMLHDMLGAPIELAVPSVETVPAERLAAAGFGDLTDEGCVLVYMPFQGSLHGTAGLIVPAASAARLAAVLTGEEIGAEDAEGLRADTVIEVGSIVLNGILGSLGNLLELPVSYDPPTCLEGPLEGFPRRGTDNGFPRRGTDNGFPRRGTDKGSPKSVPTAGGSEVLLARGRFTATGLGIEAAVVVVFEGAISRPHPSHRQYNDDDSLPAADVA